MNIVSDTTSLTALDCNGNIIAGAFQPRGIGTWRLYLTAKLVSEHHRCHPVVCTREDALQWVQVIAQLYDRANPPAYHLNGADYSGITAHLEDA
mgnify:CR=1 FL=1